MIFQPEHHPHRRFNALTGDWILVSPHRTQRPWLGQKESVGQDQRPAYDPQCYLCPGNTRAGKDLNPAYQDTFVFKNDFAALLSEATEPPKGASGLLRAQPVRGECRVICFSPRHNLTLPEMSQEQIGKVIEVWCAQTLELGTQYRWVQVFENKGATMGCSNPHPHGQIWAGDWLPNLVEKEDASQRAYLQKQGSNLLLDYLQIEVADGARMVELNEHWALLVPYWAVWPFEYLLVPRRPVQRLPELTSAERESLAAVLRLGLIRYDNLFETSFPYSMGWHGAPFDDGDHTHWQLHAHFYPPLLRSATVKKFMVGYEMMAESQRDLTAEQAASRLRATAAVHYKQRG